MTCRYAVKPGQTAPKDLCACAPGNCAEKVWKKNDDPKPLGHVESGWKGDLFPDDSDAPFPQNSQKD